MHHNHGQAHPGERSGGQGSADETSAPSAPPTFLQRRKWLRWLTAVSTILAASAVVVWWVLPFALPLPPKLLQPIPVSPTYLAADGKPLRQMLSEDGQRTAPPTRYEDFPSTLIHATLASEDKRFFTHGGVDLAAIARAVRDDLKARRIVSGASTITQQLAKISADAKAPRNIFTKLIEALQARRIEMRWTKERILTEYFNRVSYGNLHTGIASAAQGYFHKPLRDLSPAECALLAAIPQSPTRLNPYRNLHDLTKRQHLVLHRMAENGWLDDESKQLALHEKPALKRYGGGFTAPHAVALLQSGTGILPVSDESSGRMPALPTGSKPVSLTIQTTIETAIQSRVESVITRHLQLLKNKHVTHAAAVVIENKTGHVLALAGSRDFFARDGGQINGAWTPHSPGSAMKPFTYLLALQRGFTAASVIADLPIEYATPTGLYRPENYDHKNYGPVTVRTALGSSLNIPAVRVLHQIGGESVLHESLQKLGITTLNEAPDHYGLGLTIGNAPVRLLELANAYACLARLGEYKPWSLLSGTGVPPVGSSGILPVAAETISRLFPEGACYIIADVLSDNQARVLTFGPRSVIRLPFRCAVKTGTSTGYRDNWTLGYTPEFTVGVWVGNFDNTPMQGVSGVSGAGPVFREIFTALHESFGTTWYPEPAGLVRTMIDPRIGKRIATDAAPPSVSTHEVFLKGSLPEVASAHDYDALTARAFLPQEYAAWLERGDNWLSGLVCLREDDEYSSGESPRITSPANGSMFQLDPDLRDGGNRLQLRVSGNREVIWSSRTLGIERSGTAWFAKLAVGRHEIQAKDVGNSTLASVIIEVISAEQAAMQRMVNSGRQR